MLQPFLFIGVGGSGGDTLRHLHRELKQRLDRANVKMPSAWGFLHVDTRSTEEDSDDLPKLPKGSYLGLVPRNVNYRIIAQNVESKPATKSSCAGWLPDKDIVDVAIEEGAGQYRAIGRAVAIPKLGTVNSALRQFADKVESAEAKAELNAVESALTGETVTGTPPNPLVIVFSSLAGGTGSGIFLDVCDLLRGLGRTWAENSVGVLYAPDVFDVLRSDLRRSVQANALATVSELLAAHWRTNPSQDPVHQDAGVGFGQTRRSGPAYSFVVGTKNDYLNFRNQQEVFGVVARTVAAWATSQSIQKQFSSYVQSNWQQGADRADPLGLTNGALDMPFSSLGYASLGLGRDVFRRYVTQCLARASAERLLHGQGGSDGDRTAIVRQQRQRFTRAMLGLAEHNEDLYTELSPQRTQMLEAEQAGLRTATGPAARELGEWRGALGAAITERQPAFLRQQVEELRARATEWIKQAMGSVESVTQRYLASDGLNATEQLVHAMYEYLTKEEVPALRTTAARDEAFAKTFGKEVHKGLGDEPPKRFWRSKQLFPAENVRVATGVERGAEAGFGRALDAEVRLVCADLLADFAENLLMPLHEKLAGSRHGLERDAASTEDGRPSVVGQWPAGPDFPVTNALRPLRTQFVVDPVDEYPDRLAELLGVAVGKPALATGDSMPLAVNDILGTSPSPVTHERSWRPKIVRDWGTELGTTHPAIFKLQVGAHDLIDRCDAWTVQAPGLGPYIGQSLTEALGGATPTQEQYQRLTAYVAQFEQAISTSTPLVEMDAAYANLHLDNGASAFHPLISQIPLETNSVAYKRTYDLLLEHTTLTEKNLENQFSTTGSNQIEFTTFLSAPCHPVGFRSLVSPIKEDWLKKRSDTGQRTGFSRWRRARPLPSALPLPTDVRQRMVRGWFIATAGAELDLLTDQGTRLVVTSPNHAPLSFPLLGTPPELDDPFDVLAAVLESLPLVLVDPQPAVASYRHLLDVATRLDRAAQDDVVKSAVEKLAREAENRFVIDTPSQVDRAWELREDVLDAMARLTTAVGGTTR